MRKQVWLAVPVAFLLACGCRAWAFERVTLRNGFSYDCTRSEPLAGGQVRLYLRANTATLPGEANYIDLPAERIASVESLPDPVPDIAEPTNKATIGFQDMDSLLTHAGTAHNIDRELLASIVRAESSGHSTAVSRAGARGLMQLMPGTARQMGVADAFKPQDNINGGTAYLDLLLTRYRDNLALALAAYNAGPAAVDRFKGIPPFRETRLYVARVMNEFKRRKAALQTALASR